MNNDKFYVKLNKKNIFEILDIKENTQIYDQSEYIFNELEKLFYKTISPIYIYELKNKKISVYSFSIFVLISIGEKIENVIDSFFKEGEYFKAIMLNCMCDDFLMQTDKIASDEILAYICKKGIGFGERFYPHENASADVMKEIVSALNGGEWGITVNDNYVLKPAKSIGFIIGADYSVNNSPLHNCENCSAKQCIYKRRKINA